MISIISLSKSFTNFIFALSLNSKTDDQLASFGIPITSLFLSFSIDNLGKWSMADVFIVALLLTNLSLNTDDFTRAEVQVAIYFFSTYVIISMFASHMLKLTVTQNYSKEK